MMLLAVNWSVVGVQALYLLLSLSLLVILHEFGHFLPAKLFGCRIEKFFLFFDPWFALVKKKIGDTVYGIGWLPLGGYVKISGMVDESMDKEAMKKPPQPWEFRSKPAWQRLIIMLGGVTVNLLLAFFIYAMILFVWGETKTPMANVKDGIAITNKAVPDSLMYKAGFRDGDKILAIDDQPVKYYEDILSKLVAADGKVTVLRNGEQKDINLPVAFLGQLSDKKNSDVQLILPRLPILVDTVADSTAAKKAGLRKMDKIVAVNGTPTPFSDDYFRAAAMNKGGLVNLTVERGGKDTTVSAQLSKDGTLGFQRYYFMEDLDSLGICKSEKKSYGFFESFPAGVRLSLDKLGNYARTLNKMLHPKTEAYKSMGGLRTMGSIMPRQWGDWQLFWSITAFLSLILAFMNILPIPALDGGHVLFTLIEMITGRKPSDKFLEYAQITGMVLLLALMVYANVNDNFSFFKKG